MMVERRKVLYTNYGGSWIPLLCGHVNVHFATLGLYGITRTRTRFEDRTFSDTVTRKEVVAAREVRFQMCLKILLQLGL